MARLSEDVRFMAAKDEEGVFHLIAVIRGEEGGWTWHPAREEQTVCGLEVGQAGDPYPMKAADVAIKAASAERGAYCAYCVGAAIVGKEFDEEE